jgi:hypothetical protein
MENILENIVRTHWELEGNILGTRGKKLNYVPTSVDDEFLFNFRHISNFCGSCLGLFHRGESGDFVCVAKIGRFAIKKKKVPMNMVKGTFWKVSKKLATFGGNVFFLKIFKIFAWRILGGFLALFF